MLLGNYPLRRIENLTHFKEFPYFFIQFKFRNTTNKTDEWFSQPVT